ncbi:hypothetical protein DYB35_012934 [Aphanomyces astaci]|uniref:DDE-1 domain-containing protein n=1 Tax=Aphanomyces astaci TaxID=112090 RepID=A0A418DIX4_APHAT|nr:hypothetical protein DYB35_012934 [Aphanomyces astaci]
MDVVYNADQTAVNYEYLPTKTLNAKGEHTIWVKYSGKTKDRATAMVMADSTGKKYPLFMWNDSIRRQVLQHKSQTETFQLQAPKRPTLLRWITGAWSGLADSIILNGFVKCKIGAEVEVVSEPSEEVMSSDMLSDLVARCAIEDTIDPLDDLDINSDDE